MKLTSERAGFQSCDHAPSRRSFLRGAVTAAPVLVLGGAALALSEAPIAALSPTEKVEAALAALAAALRESLPPDARLIGGGWWMPNDKDGPVNVRRMSSTAVLPDGADLTFKAGQGWVPMQPLSGIREAA